MKQLLAIALILTAALTADAQTLRKAPTKHAPAKKQSPPVVVLVQPLPNPYLALARQYNYEQTRLFYEYQLRLQRQRLDQQLELNYLLWRYQTYGY